MRILIYRLAFALALFVPSVALADDPDAVKARTAYEQGMARFQLEEYDAAIAKWEDGFRIKPAPEFLYNIAQAHRLAQRHDKALSFYQRYLRMNPRAKNRAEVEKQIATLKPIVDAERQAANAPPRDPVVVPSASPLPSPSPSPSSVAVTPEPHVSPSPSPSPSSNVVAISAVSSSTPEKKPLYKKGWFWGAVVGGVVVVAAAVTLGVVFGTRTDGPRTLPAVTF